ncbi:GspH/FimT family pseudopilin [Pseudoalteromonas sp. MMG024]|uniref:GspH/FimT family pseudopilin n=1 Tax=Pseudoalteromonas sp. MMG024 TaxID=2909980 RepID=UPI001F02F8E7|nr:GspH/FimT family pseudopilin [Pseudoalteromonas sp. MMG024]MCF6457116.1 GspH/FimT family pseudopilin [Pseudoalteromonas sp. MMG024]
MKKSQTGFTILELLITVAILGIIAAITIPNYGSMLESERANNFIDEFSRTIKYARATASTSDELVVICPIKTPESGGACTTDWSKNPIVAFVDADNNNTLDSANELTLRVMDPPSDKDIIEQEAGNGSIAFDGQGRLAQQHQFVICTNGKNDHTSAVQVNVSGNTWKLGEDVLTCSGI